MQKFLNQKSNQLKSFNKRLASVASAFFMLETRRWFVSQREGYHAVRLKGKKVWLLRRKQSLAISDLLNR